MPTSSITDEIRISDPEAVKRFVTAMYEVDVAYVRSGYIPSHFDPGEAEMLQEIMAAHPDWDDYRVAEEALKD